MDEDLAAHVRSQSSLGHDVDAQLHQAIRNARPIPPAGKQTPARPPLQVTAWVVWERDGLELIDTTAEGWSGKDVLVAIQDRR